MKKIFFTLIFLSCAGAAFAQNRNCLQIRPDPNVNVTTSYGVLQYDYTKTVSELTSLGEKSEYMEIGAVSQGLAVASTLWEMSLRTRQTSEGGRTCIVPVDVDIFIGYQNPMIYIAKELSPNSCRFNLVMRHEQAHMQINKAALDFFIPILADSIRKLARDIKPVLAGGNREQIQAAASRMSEEYQKNIQSMIDTFRYELGKEQSRLDNYQHYKLESEICREFNRKY